MPWSSNFCQCVTVDYQIAKPRAPTLGSRDSTVPADDWAVPIAPVRENQTIPYHPLTPPLMSTRPSSTLRRPGTPKPATQRAKKAKPAEPRLSRMQRPPELEVPDWQTALRRQFGREQNFGLENLQTH